MVPRLFSNVVSPFALVHHGGHRVLLGARHYSRVRHQRRRIRRTRHVSVATRKRHHHDGSRFCRHARQRGENRALVVFAQLQVESRKASGVDIFNRAARRAGAS